MRSRWSKRSNRSRRWIWRSGGAGRMKWIMKHGEEVEPEEEVEHNKEVEQEFYVEIEEKEGKEDGEQEVV